LLFPTRSWRVGHGFLRILDVMSPRISLVNTKMTGGLTNN
jgi:hypothetical protein